MSRRCFNVQFVEIYLNSIDLEQLRFQVPIGL